MIIINPVSRPRGSIFPFIPDATSKDIIYPPHGITKTEMMSHIHSAGQSQIYFKWEKGTT